MTPDPGLRAYVMRSAAVCMAGLVANQAIGQLGGALIARRLASPVLYGELSLLLQLVSMAALGVGLGLDGALVYDVATGRPNMAGSLAATRNGMLALAALPVLLCVAAAPLAAAGYGIPGLAGALRIGALALFPQAALNAATALQSGLRRFSGQMALTVAATTLMVGGRLLAVPLLLRGASPGWVALGGGAGIAIVAAVGLALGARLVPGGRKGRPGGPSAGWAGEIPRMLRYGWPLWAGNLLKSFQQSYLVVVAGALGPAAAGFVANDVALIGWPFLVTWAFRLVAVPLVAAASDPAERRARASLCFRLNHLALFPVVAALCLWPHDLLAAIYGGRLAAAAGALPLLAVGVYGSSVGRLATDALAGANRTRSSLPIMLVSSLPLLAGAPFAASRGILWLGALYAVGWLASGAYALVLLQRVGLGVHVVPAFIEPAAPTALAVPLAVWAGRGGGVWAGAAAALVFAAGTLWVYRRDAWRPAAPPARRVAGAAARGPAA